VASSEKTLYETVLFAWFLIVTSHKSLYLKKKYIFATPLQKLQVFDFKIF